jgi:hypothetical protein
MLHIIGGGVPHISGHEVPQSFQTWPPQSIPIAHLLLTGCIAMPGSTTAGGSENARQRGVDCSKHKAHRVSNVPLLVIL